MRHDFSKGASAVHSDGYASVRRIDGERKWTLAIYAVDKLRIVAPESVADLSESVA